MQARKRMCFLETDQNPIGLCLVTLCARPVGD